MSLTGAIRSLFVEVGLVDAATDPMAKINKEADKTKETLGGVSKAAKEAGDSYRNVFLGVGAAAGVGGAFGLAYFSKGTKDLAEYQDAMVTFRTNMGSETDQMLAEMKRASGGVINETELIQKANLAMLLGINKNALSPMTQMARAAARQLGGDVSYYYNSLMVGTARESKLWLDNLGIIIDIDAANKKYAQTLGISANALTQEQQKIAFVNEVLAHQGDILSKVDLTQESMNEEIQRSTVTWAELQREITSGALPVILSVVKTINWGIDVIRGLPGPVKGAIGIVGILATGMLLLGSFTLLNAAAFMMLNKELVAISTTGTFWGGVQAMLIGKTGILTGAVSLLTGAYTALAASELAVLWPLIPLVGILYLLWDLHTKGWKDSMLGQSIQWLADTVPGVRAGFEWLTASVKGLWEWITKIPTAIAEAWSTVTDHPLFKVASVMFALTPMGAAINSARLVSAAAPVVIPSAERLISSTSSRSVRAGDVHY
ncbi:hypothetical protein, partial [Methanoregula sp.]|uniref:hypothetical protein n=1 Tax=Methanoregula sp. TaxID=2052170 RepID=UPI000CB287B5